MTAVLLLWAAAVVAGYLLGRKYDDTASGVLLAVFLGWLGVGLYAYLKPRKVRE